MIQHVMLSDYKMCKRISKKLALMHTTIRQSFKVSLGVFSIASTIIFIIFILFLIDEVLIITKGRIFVIRYWIREYCDVGNMN